jgi:succinate dehydrogenase / fumarate reductase membrane anchor subunit
VSRPAHGLYSWIIQRMTAVYLAVYLLYILQQWMFSSAVTYQQWKAWLASPFNGIGLGVFIVTLLLHAWIGTRDILMDYVHGLALRLSLFVLVIFILLLSGIWALRSLVIVL